MKMADNNFVVCQCQWTEWVSQLLYIATPLPEEWSR